MQIKEVFTKLEKSCGDALGTEGGVELRKMDVNGFVEYATGEIKKANEEADQRPVLAKARIESLQVSIAIAKEAFAEGEATEAAIPVFDEKTVSAAEIDKQLADLDDTIGSLKGKLSQKSDDKDKSDDKKKPDFLKDEDKDKAAADAKKGDEGDKVSDEDQSAKDAAEAKKAEEEKAALEKSFDQEEWPMDLNKGSIKKGGDDYDFGRDPEFNAQA